MRTQKIGIRNSAPTEKLLSYSETFSDSNFYRRYLFSTDWVRISKSLAKRSPAFESFGNHLESVRRFSGDHRCVALTGLWIKGILPQFSKRSCERVVAMWRRPLTFFSPISARSTGILGLNRLRIDQGIGRMLVFALLVPRALVKRPRLALIPLSYTVSHPTCQGMGKMAPHPVWHTGRGCPADGAGKKRSQQSPSTTSYGAFEQFSLRK